MTFLGAALIAAAIVNAVLVVRELALDPDRPGDPGEDEQW